MRILFQGDSITDGGRDYRNYHNLGNGYPKYAAELIQKAFPTQTFEFFNFGVAGNPTARVFERLYHDGIFFQPDVFSILVGINDIYYRHLTNAPMPILTTDEQIAANYRAILSNVKKHTNAKILVLSPYLLDCEDMAFLRPELERLQITVHALADEFADAYIPLDRLFDAALKTQPSPQYYSKDGIHPNEEGAKFIAKHYCEAIKPLINDILL